MINVYNQNIIKAFGSHLRNLRKEKGFTQMDFSKKAGIAYSQIGRIERGEQNTTLSTIALLAKTLKMSPHDLLNFKFEEKS